MEFMDQTFYALVALVLFFAVAIYAGAPKKVGSALDDRAKLIERELAEACKLREDAEKLLADYKQRKLDAEKEAQSIIARAKTDAKEFAEEARQKLSDMIARRTKQAENKIAQAQDSATKEVRGLAADLAIAASTKLIAEQGGNAKLITDSIAAVKSKLN